MTIKVGSVYSVTFKSGNTRTAFSWPSKIPDSGNKYMKDKVIKITKKLDPKDSLDYDYVGDVYDKIDGAIELKNIKIVSKQLILKSSTFKIAGKGKKSKKRTQKKSKKKNTKKKTQKKTRKRMRGGSSAGDSSSTVGTIVQLAKDRGDLGEGLDINSTDQDGNTALHIIIGSAEGRLNDDELEAVRFLLGKDANPRIKNNQNYTPLDFARIKKDQVLSDLLNGLDPERRRRAKEKRGQLEQIVNIVYQGNKPVQCVVQLTPLSLGTFAVEKVVIKLNGPNSLPGGGYDEFFTEKGVFLKQLKLLTETLLPRFANFRNMGQTNKGWLSSGNPSNSVYTPVKYERGVGNGTFGDLFLSYGEIKLASGGLLSEKVGDPFKFWLEHMKNFTERDSGRGTYGEDEGKAAEFFDKILSKCMDNKDDFIAFADEMYRLVGYSFEVGEKETPLVDFNGARRGQVDIWRKRLLKHIFNFELRGIAITAVEAMTGGGSTFREIKDRGNNYLMKVEVEAIMKVIMKTFVFFMNKIDKTNVRHLEVIKHLLGVFVTDSSYSFNRDYFEVSIFGDVKVVGFNTGDSVPERPVQSGSLGDQAIPPVASRDGGPQEDMQTKFSTAIDGEDIENMKGMLDREEISIDNILNVHGESPLLYAIRMKKPKSIELLLERGADIDFQNVNEVTPLMYAFGENNPELIATLLERGADIDIQDEKGRTALMYAVRKNDPKFFMPLLERGADIDIQDNKGKTALMYAVGANNPEVIATLLERGANKEIQDKDGKTALEHAREKKLSDIIKLLGGDAPLSDEAQTTAGGPGDASVSARSSGGGAAVSTAPTGGNPEVGSPTGGDPEVGLTAAQSVVGRGEGPE
jgi:ankyrin repeat protein